MSQFKIRTAALTDIGKVRAENEDRVISDERNGVFGVADGVGGLPGGAEAAQKAAETVLQAFVGLPDDQEPDLEAIFTHANRLVGALGRQLSPGVGIGTTLTVGSIRAGKLTIAHVGDSRCYAWRKGELTCLTEDHSVENEARRRRSLGETVHYHASQRAALTRCIGQPPPLSVDLIQRPLQPGDRYLFCTDGVTRMVTDSELADVLGRVSEPAKAIQELVALAVARGGPDNASGVVLAVSQD